MITQTVGKRKSSYVVRVGQVYGGAFDTLEAAQAKEADLKASGANKSAFDQLMDKIVELEQKMDLSKENEKLRSKCADLEKKLSSAAARIDSLIVQKNSYAMIFDEEKQNRVSIAKRAADNFERYLDILDVREHARKEDIEKLEKELKSYFTTLIEL